MGEGLSGPIPPHEANVSDIRVLFILKRRELPYSQAADTYATELSSGLVHSVRFIVDVLHRSGVECTWAQVTDNNDIDRVVHQYKPSHVIIEALWVVPEKFPILRQLHPDVQWIVRLHSEIPFLANEGIALDWITRLAVQENVSIAANSEYAYRDVFNLLRTAHPDWDDHTLFSKVLYMPNTYPLQQLRQRPGSRSPKSDALHVGCFGAIRPMKNTLLQAVAALHYAESVGRTLYFHVNGDRSEQGGGEALKNIRALFRATGHFLVEHPWLDHTQFLALLREMDLSLAVSLSETFCIVAADSVAAGVPLVVSDEIEWASPWCRADKTDSRSIVAAIKRVLHPASRSLAINHNQSRLHSWCREAEKVWLRYFG